MARRVSLSETAETGDRLATLRVLRDRLALEIEACESARDVAALSRQLREVMEEIGSLAPAETKGTVLDEIAQRRAARAAEAAGGRAASRRPR